MDTGVSVAPLRSRHYGHINWLGLQTLVEREVKRFLKVGAQTVFAPLVQTLLFMAVFGFVRSGDWPGTTRHYVDGLAAGLVMMAADTTALAEGRHPVEREPRLRSHLEAVAASRSTYGAIVANVAFVVSHSTASLHPEGYESGFAVERAWQLDRLIEQLGLEVPAPA